VDEEEGLRVLVLEEEEENEEWCRVFPCERSGVEKVERMLGFVSLLPDPEPEPEIPISEEIEDKLSVLSSLTNEVWLGAGRNMVLSLMNGHAKTGREVIVSSSWEWCRVSSAFRGDMAIPSVTDNLAPFDRGEAVIVWALCSAYVSLEDMQSDPFRLLFPLNSR
jgi:hypothetical protein